MAAKPKKNAPQHVPAAFETPVKKPIAVLQYVLSGILALGLIGWGLDSLLGTRWILFAGIALGGVSGYYTAAAHGLTSTKPLPPKGGKRPDEG
ncbi:AtpZ/AtpI family protein [Arthrobacter sp. Sa2BUA2]|uniref:AtpZ/AtpI family protein n=1 Tax=Arthrobacter pullicola TaxID=2762224 RepID=A0ABR8YK63_9MICC|nr:AtpZ/AtpI family protein [Arthrobacter pullicola]MBD8044289.1 AtpZ/AtpI family protein [Arthrobacter pullicola]